MIEPVSLSMIFGTARGRGVLLCVGAGGEDHLSRNRGEGESCGKGSGKASVESAVAHDIGSFSKKAKKGSYERLRSRRQLRYSGHGDVSGENTDQRAVSTDAFL
jgi:hypothetical protein